MTTTLTMPELTTPRLQTARIVPFPFVTSAGVSWFAFCVFLAFRGFGWDGDSLISASQFVRWLNPLIWGLDDAGTHPKALCIALFGAFYLWVPGGFYTLTFVLMALNAFVIGMLCEWVAIAGGFWPLALIGLACNPAWMAIVVNCDNPALSIPLAFAGLYCFYRLDRRKIGMVLMLLASLARPGAEAILAVMLISQFRRNWKSAAFPALLLIPAVAHTVWGWHLVYASKEQYLRLCVFYSSISVDPYYLHSWHALAFFGRSVYGQIAGWGLLLALLGVFVSWMKGIMPVCLVVLASWVPPIGAFILGTVQTIAPDKHMEFALLVPILAAMAVRTIRLGWVPIACLSLGILLYAAHQGRKQHGQFEVGYAGNGIIPWHAVGPVHGRIEALMNPFQILDNGLRITAVELYDDKATYTVR